MQGTQSGMKQFDLLQEDIGPASQLDHLCDPYFSGEVSRCCVASSLADCHDLCGLTDQVWIESDAGKIPHILPPPLPSEHSTLVCSLATSPSKTVDSLEQFARQQPVEVLCRDFVPNTKCEWTCCVYREATSVTVTVNLYLQSDRDDEGVAVSFCRDSGCSLEFSQVVSDMIHWLRTKTFRQSCETWDEIEESEGDWDWVDNAPWDVELLASVAQQSSKVDQLREKLAPSLVDIIDTASPLEAPALATLLKKLNLQQDRENHMLLLSLGRYFFRCRALGQLRTLDVLQSLTSQAPLYLRQCSPHSAAVGERLMMHV